MKSLFILLAIFMGNSVPAQHEANRFDQPVDYTAVQDHRRSEESVNRGRGDLPGNRFWTQQEVSRFNQSDDIAPTEGEEWVNRAPGDPPGPVPVNGYIPLLLAVGIGLILYQSRQKKKGTAR